MTINSSVLDAFIGFQVKQTHQFISAQFSQVLKEFKLSPAEVNVLILIDSNPNVSQAELARTMGIERASLGETLSKLDKKHMIERRSSTTDQRAKTLIISLQKQREFRKIINAINDYDADVGNALSTDELASLKMLLEKIRK